MAEVSSTQQQASRINGAKSRGPVTEEGKARSSRNAVRHGVLSSAVVMSEEEIGVAEGVRYGYVRRYGPQDQLEVEIVEGLVVSMIKLRRLDRLELEAMERAVVTDGMNEPNDPSIAKRYPTLATLGRYRGRLNHELKLSENRLMTLLQHRPESGNVLDLSAPQLRFLADMAERTEREKARLAAAQAGEAPASREPVTNESGLVGTMQRDTNEPTASGQLQKCTNENHAPRTQPRSTNEPGIAATMHKSTNEPGIAGRSPKRTNELSLDALVDDFMARFGSRSGRSASTLGAPILGTSNLNGIISDFARSA